MKNVGRHTIFVTMALAFMWIILMESVTWQNAAVGMFVGMSSMHLMGKFFNFAELDDVNFFKLAFFPLWLVGRIYKDAFFLVRIIFSSNRWGFKTFKQNLTSESLRTILADSITLTHGAVYITREDDEITLLCLGEVSDVHFSGTEACLRSIEHVLQKAEK